MLTGFVLLAGFAPWLAPADPLAFDLSFSLDPPSREHLLGTDELGRDLLSRIIFGTRYSLAVGASSVAIAAVVGILIGLGTGYFGGNADRLLMRIVDVFLAFPSILFALLLVTILGTGLLNTVIAVGTLNIFPYSRLVRGIVLAVKEREYVLAARAIGCGDIRILFRHVFPNIVSPIIVHSTFLMAFAISLGASLSFLGLGVQKPLPEWGAMLASGYAYLSVAPHIAIGPGVALFSLLLALNICGDGLRDLLDPTLRDL